MNVKKYIFSRNLYGTNDEEPDNPNDPNDGKDKGDENEDKIKCSGSFELKGDKNINTHLFFVNFGNSTGTAGLNYDVKQSQVIITINWDDRIVSTNTFVDSTGTLTFNKNKSDVYNASIYIRSLSGEEPKVDIEPICPH